jgi:hypothetical protein
MGTALSATVKVRSEPSRSWPPASCSSLGYSSAASKLRSGSTAKRPVDPKQPLTNRVDRPVRASMLTCRTSPAWYDADNITLPGRL